MSDSPVVVVREPGRSPLHVMVTEPLEVGRGGSGLLVDDPAVSRRHLELRPDQENGLLVHDLGSANGTTIDGRPVTEPSTFPVGAIVRFGDTTIELMERTIGLVASLDAERARTSIERVAAEVARDKPRPPSAEWGDGTVTIAFSDIESSTELAQRIGDQRWFAILEEHNDIIRRHVRSEGGVEIKAQGDGFMLAFASARTALRCLTQVQRTVTASGERDPERAIRVRFGAHTGEVIVDDAGDLFGHHVNLAARIAGEAAGGEILVSSLVKEIVEARGEFTFGEPRSATLKGLGGTWLLHPVVWRTQPPGS